MNILSKQDIKEGGFAGLREHRFVMDSKVFGLRKEATASDGLGNCVYLADAYFNPHGETGMHPHKEVDVISVMVEGRIAHEGSLEHGQVLKTGDVQVQRAGGEGFSHNEINPDDTKNRMVQLWVLPEAPGEAAAYKVYQPKASAVTRIYGGSADQENCFPSQTVIEIIHLNQGDELELEEEGLTYITKGRVEVEEGFSHAELQDGNLLHSTEAKIKALSDSSLISIYKE